jgi:adenosylcobinamide kinase / adenosylcobinamide-phosphate guanylyltransferase
LITFVFGGARSGKSSFALKSASEMEGRKAYIATAQALDDEMQERIEKHKQERSSAWDTFEEPLHISELLGGMTGKYGAVVIDCLTLWLSNLMHHGSDIEAEMDALIVSARLCDAPLFVISNEVGSGIVPENKMARIFRDYAGVMNRRMAGVSDNVYLLAAGIPLKIK